MMMMMMKINSSCQPGVSQTVAASEFTVVVKIHNLVRVASRRCCEHPTVDLHRSVCAHGPRGLIKMRRSILCISIRRRGPWHPTSAGFKNLQWEWGSHFFIECVSQESSFTAHKNYRLFRGRKITLNVTLLCFTTLADFSNHKKKSVICL